MKKNKVRKAKDLGWWYERFEAEGENKWRWLGCPGRKDLLCLEKQN